MITESTIILAIIGMLGLFSTALIWQRSNRITSTYYASRRIQQDRQVQPGDIFDDEEQMQGHT